VKRHQLLDHLQRHGCRLHREGGRHSIFMNSATGAKAPIPRHSEIDNRLAAKICQQLGVVQIGRK
jgi:mRNA interferase HicA